MKHMKDISTLVFRTMGSSIFCVDSQGGGGFQISTLLNSPFSKIIYKGGGRSKKSKK